VRNRRRRSVIVTMSLALLLLITTAARGDGPVQTIVFIRHGEKPDGGLGQLTCQGLNRALALPAVIGKRLGTPDAIFAPNPSVQKNDDGKPYYYVRPLATVEPTAIRFGLPVNVGIGAFDTDALRAALESPGHRDKLILVAWEHHEIETIVRVLLGAHQGDPSIVPRWHGHDYDSIYVVRIAWVGDVGKASFARMQEGLDGLPTTCPP
jgi:hypothetical protein